MQMPKVFTATVLSLLILTFATWTLSLAGLAGVQDRCSDNKTQVPGQGYFRMNAGAMAGVRGFSATQRDCTQVFR